MIRIESASIEIPRASFEAAEQSLGYVRIAFGGQAASVYFYSRVEEGGGELWARR